MSNDLNLSSGVPIPTYSGNQLRMNNYLHISEIELNGLMSRMVSGDTTASWAMVILGAILGYLFDALSSDGITQQQFGLMGFGILFYVILLICSHNAKTKFNDDIKIIKNEMCVWDVNSNNYVPHKS